MKHLKYAIYIPLALLVGLWVFAVFFHERVYDGVFYTDRAGLRVLVPYEIETIISLGASNTEILVELGFGDYIIATDAWSAGIAGLPQNITVVNMLDLDAEELIALEADVIFITPIRTIEGSSRPLETLRHRGEAVITIPEGNSVDCIVADILLIAEILGVVKDGVEVISDMLAEIQRISEIVEQVETPRTVYFEIDTLQNITTFGSDTILNELIELSGAVNAFANQTNWIAVTENQVIEANPDVILTSVPWLPDPVANITQRTGWHEINAVQQNKVFAIDPNTARRNSHNIVTALQQIAIAIYPEYFDEY